MNKRKDDSNSEYKIGSIVYLKAHLGGNMPDTDTPLEVVAVNWFEQPGLYRLRGGFQDRNRAYNINIMEEYLISEDIYNSPLYQALNEES